MEKKYSSNWESLKTHQVPGWYEDCKFGIFIHWGLFSVPAYAPRTCELGTIPGDERWFANNPYAEWYYNSVNIGYGPSYEHHKAVYGNDFKYFDFIPMWKAENWHPEEWADLFRKAGAKYVVLVSKHHDGFCLFDSQYTDYNSVKMGPGRDIVGELTEAVRNSGLRMGLYYSGILDWTYANDPICRDADLFDNACPTFEYADYAYHQSKELIDRYKPSVFWNDIGWPRQGEQALPYLLSHYYNTVGEGVVNDRFNGLYQDFSTREYQLGKVLRNEKWEMCRGMGLSFGYNAEEGDDSIISVPDAVSLLIGTVAENGNLLLNIGPKPDGTIPAEQVRRLRAIGGWLERNGDAIYGTRCSRHVSRADGSPVRTYFTSKGKDLYVILDRVPVRDFAVSVPGVHGQAVPLDPSVGCICTDTAAGIELQLSGMKENTYAVALRVTGGEEA